MANKRFSDVHPCHNEKDSAKAVSKPSGKNPPGSADFKQHPHHTGPKVDGLGEVPKA